jgi:hypothetical protein
MRGGVYNSEGFGQSRYSVSSPEVCISFLTDRYVIKWKVQSCCATDKLSNRRDVEGRCWNRDWPGNGGLV